MDFTKVLIRWYSENKRSLPWRKTKDPYYIWLSEIIMQQTQIKQGLPYYEAFVKAYPSVFDLASAKESEVLKLWQGLGYYSRARNLHYTAKYIANEYKGKFPESYKGLLELKGVGDYTASAIASICYNLPNAVVDGNVYRVLSRYYGIDSAINSSKGIKEFKALASTLLDQQNPGDYNQAIMEFGATQCKPKNPNCSVCPLNSSCVALSTNRIPELPFKLKKLKIKQRYFNYLVVLDPNKNMLFEERKSKGIWQNLYQFPLIESDRIVDENYIKKHKNFKELIGDSTPTITCYNDKPWVHKLSHQHLNTTFWILELNSPLSHGLSIAHIKSLPTSSLVAKFMDLFFK